MKLKMIDAFSGIGGFSYAAEKFVGGFQTTQFIENDSYCKKVLKKHWPKIPIHNDIRTFNAKPYSADIITGGFPCQDISTGGQGKGITKETRSGLFYQLIRIIRMVRPKYVILENVAAILNNGLDIVLGELAESRFYCEWACIPASALGACHTRDRWFLVAADPQYFGLSPTQKTKSNEQSCQTKAGQKTTFKFKGGNKSVFSEDFSRITEKWKPTRFMLNPNWRQYNVERGVCGDNDGVSNRIYRNSRIKALGNSVVPQVAAIPLQRVLDLQKNYG